MTATFPLAFADTMNRMLLAEYQATQPVMRQFFRTRGVPDLTRSAKMNLVDGQVKRLQHVPEGDDYTDDSEPSEEQKTVTPQKFGRKREISLEASLADDLGVFQRLPGEMAQSARNTEEWYLTQLLFDSAGPLDSIFNATSGTDFGGGFGQQGVASTALSVPNLETAIEEMIGGVAGYRNTMGEPILNMPGFLMVAPNQHVLANKILDSSVLQGNTDNLPTANRLQEFGLRRVTNPWIPVVVTTGTLGSTAWVLLSSTISAGDFINVNGHEAPELFIRTSNSQRIGGGGQDPLDGSFENDSIGYKVRYMFNAMTGDPRFGWASDGQ